MFPRICVMSLVTSLQVVYWISWGHSATITGCDVIDIKTYDSRMEGHRSTLLECDYCEQKSPMSCSQHSPIAPTSNVSHNCHVLVVMADNLAGNLCSSLKRCNYWSQTVMESLLKSTLISFTNNQTLCLFDVWAWLRSSSLHVQASAIRLKQLVFLVAACISNKWFAHISEIKCGWLDGTMSYSQHSSFHHPSCMDTRHDRNLVSTPHLIWFF